MTALRKTARVVERAWRQDNGPKSYPHYCAVRQSDKCTPVAVVSLTPESIEALVEKAARAIGENSGYGTKAIELEMAKTDPEDQGNIWRDYARAALTAILGKTGRGK